MAGIQISGLASGINWQNIVNLIVQADSARVNQVKARQVTVNSQVTALSSLSTELNSVSSAIFTLEDAKTYGNVTAASTTSGSTWSAVAAPGTATGSYKIAVTQLATTSQLDGANGVSTGLNGSGGSDVSGLTLANMPVAQPVTAGNFTINGHQVAITTSESLADVFTAIQTATGGDVTGSYNPGTDKVTLSSASHATIILGASNDTSNVLQALKLSNNATFSVSSSTALGTLELSKSIATSNLATAVTGVDGSGNGSFLINGVSIAYNVNTTTLSTVLGRINNSKAGVTASYDANNNRVVLTNLSTGNSGIGLSDTTGNLLGALGLTSGATLVQGNDAKFSVNGGATLSSGSNILNSAQLGVTGLSVTVNTTDTQTVQVSGDTSVLQTAIQTFISSFNALQSSIKSDTRVIVTSSGTVGTSILSADHEVGNWAGTLELKAFGAGSGLTGAITSLDAMGIDFNGTTGQLGISNNAKFQQALTQNPVAVAAFFQTANTGFGSIMNGAVTNIINQSSDEQQVLQSESSDMGHQITTMQSQIATEQRRLEAEFTAMENAIAQAQSDSSALSGMLGTGSTTASSSSSGLNTLTSSVNNATSSSSTSPGG